MSGAAVQLRALAVYRAAPLWLHLRDHGVDADTFADAARSFVDRIRAIRFNALISINTHLDVAEVLGTGIHVGTRGPSVREVRSRLGARALVSASAHTVEEARAAEEQRANAILFSPVFSTTSKPGHPGAGLDALRACCEAVPRTAVLALGGVTPDRVRPCLDAGAQSVAVLSGILHANDPVGATAQYHAQLQRR